jgi:hypothetical protein
MFITILFAMVHIALWCLNRAVGAATAMAVEIFSPQYIAALSFIYSYSTRSA